MPSPYDRDRVIEGEGGALVLSCFRPKGWTARPEVPGGTAGIPIPGVGTAVQWEDAVYEVVRVETSSSGGTRYTLEPWDGRQVIRQLERYGPANAGGAPGGAPAAAGTAPASFSPAVGQARGQWERIPPPYRVLLLGFVPGVALSSFCVFHLMGEGMSFLVHELGHTVTAIAFGMLAVPAVVMTITFDQSRLAAGAIWIALVGLVWRLRSVPRWRVAAASAAALYPLIAFTPVHLDAIRVAGHLAEVVVAAFFFHRAVTGGLFSEWERPVYAFFAWSLWLRNVRLFFGVAFDAQARTDYLTVAITGENDLVTLANAHGLDLATVATAALVLAAAIPAAGLLLAFRSRRAAAPG